MTPFDWLLLFGAMAIGGILAAAVSPKDSGKSRESQIQEHWQKLNDLLKDEKHD
jgi:hypothetical protein